VGKPIADPGQICPLMHKDVSRVCHKCAWYVPINGMDMSTGQPREHWACSMVQLVFTTAETVRTTAQTTASVDVMRHEHAQERRAQTRLLGLRPATELPNDNEKLRLTDNRQATE